jgi:AraC-like DNA-binding protein
MAHSPVAHFYSFKADYGIEQTIVVPDGCFDLIFACGPSRAEASIYGTVTVNTRFAILPGATYFGVRFHPGVLPWGMGFSGAELVDRSFRLSDVPEWNLLARQIMEEDAFTKRVELFASKSAKVGDRQADSASFRLALAALGAILARRGDVQVGTLEAETGYSARYIDKTFTEYLGVSPKSYCKFIRFQTLLCQINRREGETLMDSAIESGYYDHSHMLRDFKAFTSFSPRQYTNAVNLPFYASKIIDVSASTARGGNPRVGDARVDRALA